MYPVRGTAAAPEATFEGETNAMDNLIGCVLKGKFQITERIGEGAMGTVFRAVDLEAGRDVALKIMHPGLMQQPGMLTRFRREATAMRQVRHPNAVEVFAHGFDQGLVFLAMELVTGRDLGECLAKEQRLPVARAVSIVADVCSALAEAHAHGLVHRDIKPENVMLGGSLGDTAKLIDFGIAKAGVHLDGGDNGSDALGDALHDERPISDSIPDDIDLDHDGASVLDLTSAGQVVGSPGYMAPEQWASGAVDPRTDVYACGVLLYQLVTGRLPFDDENPFRLAQRQIAEQPAPPHLLRPEVPAALSALILRALQPVPRDRFQTAAHFCGALRAHLVEQAIAQTLGLDATLPLETMSPLPEDLGSTLVLDPPAPLAPDSMRAQRRAESRRLHSAARNGRITPVNPMSLARSSRPPPMVHAGLMAVHFRALLPIAAAFLALGVVLGMILFFPGLHH
jgi:serine/threonine protein kinase